MPGSVIVPLDGSTAAERALPYAAAIARRTGATLDLVRVQTPDLGEPWVWSVRGSGSEGEVARRRALAAAYLAEAAQRVPAAPRLVRTVVLDPPVERALVGYARRSGSLVVMAMRGYESASVGSIGTTADRVARWSGLPVLLIPPADRGFAADDADWRCEHILLLEGAAGEAELVQGAVSALAGAFDSRVTTLAGSSVTEVLSPRGELEVDVIALGVHGRPDGGVLRYGSTASRLLRQSPVPVLVSCSKSRTRGPGGARHAASHTPAPAA